MLRLLLLFLAYTYQLNTIPIETNAMYLGKRKSGMDMQIGSEQFTMWTVNNFSSDTQIIRFGLTV